MPKRRQAEHGTAALGAEAVAGCATKNRHDRHGHRRASAGGAPQSWSRSNAPIPSERSWRRGGAHHTRLRCEMTPTKRGGNEDAGRMIAPRRKSWLERGDARDAAMAASVNLRPTHMARSANRRIRISMIRTFCFCCDRAGSSRRGWIAEQTAMSCCHGRLSRQTTAAWFHAGVGIVVVAAMN